MVAALPRPNPSWIQAPGCYRSQGSFSWLELPGHSPTNRASNTVEKKQFLRLRLDWWSQKSCFLRLDLPVDIISQKSVFAPIPSLIPSQNTPKRPHIHTKYRTAVTYRADAGLAAITAAGSRRKSAWRIPSSARQQRVSYDHSGARHQCYLPTTATPAVAVAPLG